MNDVRRSTIFHILPNLLKKKLNKEFQLRYEMLPFHISSCLATFGQSKLFCTQYPEVNVPSVCVTWLSSQKKKEYISNACNTHQLMISFSYYLTNNYLDGAESDLRSWYFISWLRNFRRFMNTVVSSPRSQELTTCLNLDPH